MVEVKAEPQNQHLMLWHFMKALCERNIGKLEENPVNRWNRRLDSNICD
jgi:hypothetical protein